MARVATTANRSVVGRRMLATTAAAVTLGTMNRAAHAAEQYFAGDGSALTTSKYGTSPTGTFTSAFTTGSVFGYGNTTAGTGTGGTIAVGGFDIQQNFTITTASGTISNSLNGTANGIVPISVTDGVAFNAGSQAFTTSTTAGYVKGGNGTLALAGGTYGGGFTLNAGTVILNGVNALGSATGNTLTINGGTLAGSASRTLTGKYSGGITIGGDFQLGAFAASNALASDTANLTFSDNVNLGAVTRTITLGNKGNQTLGGVISGGAGVGLTFAAATGADSTQSSNGVIAITGTANTFTGPININGPEVTFAGDGSLGDPSNTLCIDGGRFTATASFTLTAGRGIQLGATTGTSISTKGGSTVLTYNGTIADKSGVSGSFAKQGAGTFAFGGSGTYSGATSINNGTLQLTTADNRLPTGTMVTVGQAASSNVGAFDLNGFNQQVAGLNSITGTNASATAKNTGKSTGGTLTLGGGGSYAYGDGTVTNSGVITGALAIAKTGSGTQIFGDANTYSGGTTVAGGVLLSNGPLLTTTGSVTSAGTGTGPVLVNSGGTLAGNGGAGAVTVSTGGTISAGTGATASSLLGHLTTAQQTWAGGTYTVKLDGASSSPAAAGSGASGTAGADELLISGLAASTGLTINPVMITSGSSSFLAGQSYSYVIVDDAAGAANSTATTFDGLALTSIAVPASYSLSTGTDGTPSGQDLILSFTTAAAPEPTSLLLVGIAAAPLAVGRRRRRA